MCIRDRIHDLPCRNADSSLKKTLAYFVLSHAWATAQHSWLKLLLFCLLINLDSSEVCRSHCHEMSSALCQGTDHGRLRRWRSIHSRFKGSCKEWFMVECQLVAKSGALSTLFSWWIWEVGHPSHFEQISCQRLDKISRERNQRAYGFGILPAYACWWLTGDATYWYLHK